MTGHEIETSDSQETKKHLDIVDAVLIIPILALFVPYGLEYYVIPMCEHIGTTTTWLLSAPLWFATTYESSFVMSYTFTWYLFLVRALSVAVILFYYNNRLSKNLTVFLLMVVFLIELVLIIIPLPTGYVSTPAFSIPIPVFTLLCLLRL